MRFSINCSTVICSPTVLFAILREASSETYVPGSIFHHISFRSTILQSFTFRSINQKPKNTLSFVYLSLLDLSFASNHEGIDNPFIALGASCLIVVHVLVICALCPTRLIPGSLTAGNTYLYFAASPFPLQGKKQRKLKK